MTKIKKGDVVLRNTIDGVADPRYVVLKVNKENYVQLLNIDEGYADGTALGNLYATTEKPFKVVKGAVDGYDGFALKRGKKQYISVGCRVFTKLSEAKKHWAKDGGDHDRADYDDNGWEQRLSANAKRYERTKALVAKLKEQS